MKIKKRKKRSQVILNPRDCSILISIFKNKVMTLAQIHQYFFENRCKSVSSRRLLKLGREKLVNKKALLINNKNCTYYSITEKGVELIKHDLYYEVENKNYKSDSVRHDIELVNISERLKETETVKYLVYESELLSSPYDHLDEALYAYYNLQTDLVLKIQQKEGFKGYVALEYERSLKVKRRNIKKLSDYYRYDQIKGVFYICENESIKKSLMKVDEEECANDKSKIYFCTLEEFKKSKNMIVFVNCKGKKIGFDLIQPKAG